MLHITWAQACRQFLIGCALFLLLAPVLLAQAPALEATPELLRATVAYVADSLEINTPGGPATHQALELVVSAGPRKGEILTLEQVTYHATGQRPYREGDWVYVELAPGLSGEQTALITGRAREPILLAMTVGFVLLVIWVGRLTGARALAGLLVGVGVILWYILPRIAAGHAPLQVALIGSALAMPATYYVTHGLKLKTSVALIASWAGLLLTAGLALLLTHWAYLTGFASDEAGFVQAIGGGNIDIKGLLIAGMVISVVGVLDDITVAQAAVVEQLALADRALSIGELYRRAMSVGRDHIGSMVNTLVMVYAGAALPLLLLLGDRSVPLGYALSHEVIAEEVVRTLVTSSGLIAVVPLVTVLAAAVFGWRSRNLLQESAVNRDQSSDTA